MATVAERAERRRRKERHALTIAARYDIFSLGALWKENPWIQYGHLSRMLLGWWRFIDGQWRPGYVFRRVPTTARPAIYRWIDE